MKKILILVVFLLLISCQKSDNTQDITIIKNSAEIINLWYSIDPKSEMYLDPSKIEHVHKRWWKHSIYDNRWLLARNPDFTEEYYTVNPPQKYLDKNKVEIYIQWWDSLLTKEERDQYIQDKKESLKSIFIFSKWDEKYVFYRYRISHYDHFEESMDITFNLGNYNIEEIPE